MVYIAEMMPAHSRGKYQGQMAALGSLGVPFGIRVIIVVAIIVALWGIFGKIILWILIYFVISHTVNTVSATC